LTYSYYFTEKGVLPRAYTTPKRRKIVKVSEEEEEEESDRDYEEAKTSNCAFITTYWYY